MANFSDSEKGFGNEPIEDRYPNGRVLNERDLPDPHFDNDDDHYAAVEALMESAPTDAADAAHRLNYKPEEYEKSAAQAARMLLSLDEEATEGKEAGLPERLTTIEQRFGFVPHTKEELSDAYDLTGKDLVGGAATHLNIVLNRQKPYMEDPARTVRAIVTRYVDYATNAFAEKAFAKQIEESFGDGKGGVNVSSLGTEWQYSGSLSRPILHTLWMRHVTKYMRGDDTDSDPLKAFADGAYNASNKGAVSEAEGMITKGKKADLSEDFRHYSRSEEGRFEFWVDALQQARSHRAAAGIAYDALVKLGIEKDERT